MPEEYKNTRFRVKLVVYNIFFVTFVWRNLVFQFRKGFILSLLGDNEEFNHTDLLPAIKNIFATGAFTLGTLVSMYAFNYGEFNQQGTEPIREVNENEDKVYQELEKTAA
jgi:hypothetical protein